MVYVVDNNGNPLMPTKRHGWVRRSIRDGKAIVINRMPFTIKLQYDSGHNIQPVTLGIDIGSRHIGLSASTTKDELYSAEGIVRDDIHKLIERRKEIRKSRRSRNVRYRQDRHLNRHRHNITPSLKRKVETHIHLVKFIGRILPLSKISIERNSFRAKRFSSKIEKRVDETKRMAVIRRDGGVCQCCYGKSGNKRLHVHHIESRITGNDSYDNLITLCETCHILIHNGKIELKHKRHGILTRWQSHMNVISSLLCESIRMLGYSVCDVMSKDTQENRIVNGISKTHFDDAFVISGNLYANRIGMKYLHRFIRRHNRQLHRECPSKGGVRRRSCQDKFVFGFQHYDEVEYNGKRCFVINRKVRGYFSVMDMNGNVLQGISYRKLKRIRCTNSMVTTLFT